MKRCIGTKTVKGCFEMKPIADFRLYPNTTANVCRGCMAKHKREKYQERKKESALVNKLISGAW